LKILRKEGDSIHLLSFPDEEETTYWSLTESRTAH
jgi:hypothetical protein